MTKRTRKRDRKNKPEALSPAHEEAQGIACDDRYPGHQHDEMCATSDVDKTMGNPYSTGIDASNRQVNSRELAFRHEALRQSDPTVRPFANLQQRAGNFIGQVGFGGMDAGRDNVTNRVQVDHLDAAELAGSYTSRYDCTPGNIQGHPVREDWHTARNSATPANPFYPQSPNYADTTPRQSMKNSDALQVMKQALFGHD